MTKRTDLTNTIGVVAQAWSLDANLIEALVIRESRGDHWAWRPEVKYPYLWDVALRKPFRKLFPYEVASKAPPTDFPFLGGSRQQEWVGQQSSWGLMQIMGAVAREQGFEGTYLTELVLPETNLRIGCRYFASLLERAGGDVEKTLAAYNAGFGNLDAGRQYAENVLATYSELIEGKP